LEFPKDMVAKRNRDQRTPRQSHSIASYRETGMGSAERLNRDGEEPFVQEDSKPLVTLRNRVPWPSSFHPTAGRPLK